MKTDDRPMDQLDSFESRLFAGLDRIASTTPASTPTEFHPDAMPFFVDNRSRHSFKLMALAVAALVAVTVIGLVAIGARGEDVSVSNQPPGEAEPNSPAPNATPAFLYETPTVLLEADTVEVITASGVFAPTADVIVDGDPGMPNEYTTLELTWYARVEQRINIWFASDGTTWWVTEIRTYDGADSPDWIEPFTTGRFFESPLGTPYIGDIELPNLRISGMTLQAFLGPATCDTTTAPVVLIADYPSIHGRSPGGFGASFQVYDTATCTPLPIGNYTFEFTTDNPDVAVITELDQFEPANTDPTTSTTPDFSTTTTLPKRDEFSDIKYRIELNFPGPGSTTLHATARDTRGTAIGAIDIPIVVEALDDANSTPDTAVPLSSETLPPNDG